MPGASSPPFPSERAQDLSIPQLRPRELGACCLPQARDCCELLEMERPFPHFAGEGADSRRLYGVSPVTEPLSGARLGGANIQERRSSEFLQSFIDSISQAALLPGAAACCKKLLDYVVTYNGVVKK